MPHLGEILLHAHHTVRGRMMRGGSLGVLDGKKQIVRSCGGRRGGRSLLVAIREDSEELVIHLEALHERILRENALRSGLDKGVDARCASLKESNDSEEGLEIGGRRVRAGRGRDKTKPPRCSHRRGNSPRRHLKPPSASQNTARSYRKGIRDQPRLLSPAELAGRRS